MHTLRACFLSLFENNLGSRESSNIDEATTMLGLVHSFSMKFPECVIETTPPYNMCRNMRCDCVQELLGAIFFREGGKVYKIVKAKVWSPERAVEMFEWLVSNKLVLTESEER